MRFITQSSIDNVLDEADILKIVSASETMEKKGVHDFCRSPFNDKDKTPSLCVNKVKNRFFDYSEGFGGNAVSFLMKRHSINFFEAIEKAAEICGIILQYEEQSPDAKRMQDEILVMKKLVNFMTEEFQKQFHKLEDNSWAKELIISERKFSKEVIENFMLGFAPNKRDFISSTAINTGTLEIAKSLGYTKTENGSSYDFLRNRIIFPIQNEKGEVIGFGGRTDNSEESKQYAKYLNSPESKLYQKEKVLYGIWQAKKSIVSSGKAIMMEGYTDVIALHQNGVTNSIAPCGTALTELQVKLLSRFCKHVVLFLDGDSAGHKAAVRSIDLYLKQGFKVDIVICLEGQDPDSLSRECNINDFITKNSQDAVLWKAKLMISEAKNPELIALEATLKKELDHNISELKHQISNDETLKKLTPVDRKLAKKTNDSIVKSISDLEKELKDELADLPQHDPSLISKAVEGMANTLHAIQNKITQASYVKHVAKILEQKPQVLTNLIRSFEENEERENKNKKQESDKKEFQILGLPEGADKDQFLKDRFCEVGNVYHFKRDNAFILGTNFRITPLFHVEGRAENKRLCEVINHLGHKRLVDFESTDLINFTKLKERLIREGFYFFEPGVNVNDFQLVAKKLLNDFITASELKILGQQRQGFFAFADGVYHDNQFKAVNKYGIVQVEGLEKTESEYRSDITHFYSPSHSEIYKAANEGDDPFENDRYFVHKSAPISLENWATQMVTVFGDKGKLGIAFCIAANFRDLFIQHYNFFPLFGGFGQKDSGKSGFGSCLQSFFYWNLNPLELNTSTLVGLARRLTRCKNTIVFCDEMRDDIDESMHQTLKGTWNGIGREKGKGFDSNKTTVDKINSAVYYSGQYLPTRDDGALPSRSIITNFENKDYSPAEKEEYNKLISWNKAGISSFIIDVIKHREFMSANMTRIYAETAKELKLSLKDQEYQNRVFDNYLQLLVTVKMLKDKFKFPFTYDEYFQLTQEQILENSETIADSDGLAAFWRIVEYLVGSGFIKQGEDFLINRDSTADIIPKKGEKLSWKNENHDKIIYINFNKIWQDYQKEVTKRQGEELIGMTTIRNYFKSKKYFIGLFGSKRMGNKCPSGYILNYSMMQRLGILNIDDITDTQTEMKLPEGF
ncbi:DNA primase [Flavobacterium oncorhynchi]|uniref:DNA primase n=1 Tax=Flavobacterium oncorhynchi TaxID=728056 RepID=UPI00351A4213